MNLNKKNLELIRSHAWNYFDYHGKQRLIIFNFYILICSLITTGYFATLKAGSNPERFLALGLLLIFLTAIFRKLDIRTKHLIKISEASLKKVEDNLGITDPKGSIHHFKIFRYEDYFTEEQKKNNNLWFISTYYTFSDCFHLVFLLVIGVGILMITFAIFNLNWSNFLYLN